MSVITISSAGYFFPSATPTGPQPQPRSSTRPSIGTGSAFNRASVPLSSPSRENTPASVVKTSSFPSAVSATRRSSWAEAGFAV